MYGDPENGHLDVLGNNNDEQQQTGKVIVGGGLNSWEGLENYFCILNLGGGGS